MRLDNCLAIETYHAEVLTCLPYSPACAIVKSASIERQLTQLTMLNFCQGQGSR